MVLTELSALITGTKAAIDIGKLVNEAASSLDNAELQLHIVDLTNALRDLQLTTGKLDEKITQQEAEIKQLNEALRIKGEVMKFRDAYYLFDERLQPVGDPYCLGCWEINHKLVHLQVDPVLEGTYTCPLCKTSVAHVRVAI